MNHLLENFIKEVLSEEKEKLQANSCGCAEGESCEECGMPEVDEVSTLGGGAIRGVITPLGAGPKGKVRYKSGKEKDSPLNKSPSYYIRKGHAKKPKRKFGKK